MVVLGSLYVYAPNKVAPIIFTILFAISAVLHICQCYRLKSWSLTGLQALCAVFFTAGYTLREYGAFDHYLLSTSNLIVFIMSQVFIYICPPFLELSNYHVLGRIFSYIPHQTPIPQQKVLPLFGGLVAIVEALNGLGVAFVSNSSSTQAKQQLGSDFLNASLAIQLLVIMTCFTLAAIFHRRCMTSPTGTAVVAVPLYTLYGSMAFILVRSIFRLVQNNSGNVSIDIDDLEELENLSLLVKNEWYFWVFEALPLMLNSFLWNFGNPRHYLPADRGLHLAQDGFTVVKGPCTVDRRSMFELVGHVFTFGLLFGRREKVVTSDFELDDSETALRGSRGTS